MDPADTRQRILEAAAVFYAERGFEGTSLRALTDAADVNLAAVNYHFGSKESLMWEMFRARIVPMNAERLRLLDEAMATSGGKPSLEAVFDALLVPMFDAAQGPNGPNTIFLRIVGRVLSESEAVWVRLHEEFFEEITTRFMEAIGAALPTMPELERQWRFHFAISTMLGALVSQQSLEQRCAGGLNTTDLDETRRRLRDFICGGFRAAREASA